MATSEDPRPQAKCASETCDETASAPVAPAAREGGAAAPNKPSAASVPNTASAASMSGAPGVPAASGAPAPAPNAPSASAASVSAPAPASPALDPSLPFFTNYSCPHFPCHEGVAPELFNCLFCFCPLYTLGSNCGGNFTYTASGTKSCIKCSLPHEGNNGNILVSERFSALSALASRKRDGAC